MTFNEATSNIDTRDLTSLIEKSKRVLVDAYIAMTHQRYKNDVKKTIKETDPKKLSEELNKKINEQITYRLDTLQRECKYNDLYRAKREAGLWKEFITKIISETNRGIWMSGTDGRKYKSIVEQFEKLVSDILGEAKQTITPEKIEPQSTETKPELINKEVYSFDLVTMEQTGFMPKLGGAGSARETSGWSATCKVSDEKEFERLKKNNFNVELVLSSPNKTLHGTKLIISDELKKQINTHYFGGPVFEGTTKDGKTPSFNNPLIVTKVSVWMSKIDASSKSSKETAESKRALYLNLGRLRIERGKFVGFCDINDVSEFNYAKKSNFDLDIILSCSDKSLDGTKLIIDKDLKKLMADEDPNKVLKGGLIFTGKTTDGKLPNVKNPINVSGCITSLHKPTDDKAVGALNPGDSEIFLSRETQKERFLKMREKRNKRLGNPVPEVMNKKVEPVAIKRFDSLA